MQTIQLSMTNGLGSVDPEPIRCRVDSPLIVIPVLVYFSISVSILSYHTIFLFLFYLSFIIFFSLSYYSITKYYFSILFYFSFIILFLYYFYYISVFQFIVTLINQFCTPH